MYQSYISLADGTFEVNVTANGCCPVNTFIENCPTPVIQNAAILQSSTGGTIPGGIMLRLAVCATQTVSGLTSCSPPSAIIYCSIPSGTNTNSLTVTNIWWPTFSGLTGYVLFASQHDDLICAQVSGSLSGTPYTPTSISLTSVLRSTWTLPNENISYVLLKGKRVQHGGVEGAVVNSITTNSITCAECVDVANTDNWTGRYIIPIGRMNAEQPFCSFLCTSFNPATGKFTLDRNPTVSGHPEQSIQVDDAIVVSFAGYDNSSNPTVFTDAGLSNAQDEPTPHTGLVVNSEQGFMVRVLAGTSRGYSANVVSNTATSYTLDRPIILDASSVWIVEFPTWVFPSQQSDIGNTNPFNTFSLSLPVSNYLDETLLIGAFLVDNQGNQSNEQDALMRMIYIYGQTGSGGSTPAPNVTATVVPRYSLLGNATVVNFSGVITLPTGSPDYSELSYITITAVPPGGSSGTVVQQLYAPFSGGTVNYQGTNNFAQAITDQTWTLTFQCFNTSGAPTESPVSYTVSVAASKILSLTGGDASALSTGDPKYQARTTDADAGVHFMNWVVPVAEQLPCVVSIFINDDGWTSTGWNWVGNYWLTTSGQVISFGGEYGNVPSLSTTDTWQLGCIAGWWAGAEQLTSLPSGSVTSSSYTVSPVGAISTSDFPAGSTQFTLNSSTGLYVDYGLANPGVYTYAFHNLQITFPSVDLNLWDILATVQGGTLVGSTFTPTADVTGTERQVFSVSTFVSKSGSSVQPAMGTTQNITGLEVDGTNFPTWPIPTVANSVNRWRLYASSRLGTSATVGGAGTRTLLTGWPGGASSYDLAISNIPPTQALDLSQSKSGTYTNGLTNTSGSLQINPTTMTAGQWTHTQIASVSATSLTGLIQAAQIQTVNVTSLTGQIIAGQIQTVNASTITIGQMQDSQIGNVNVSKLLAGTATFTGTVTLQQSGGSVYVQLTSSGMTIQGASGSQLAMSSSGASFSYSGTYTIIQGGAIGCLSVTGGTVNLSGIGNGVSLDGGVNSALRCPNNGQKVAAGVAQFSGSSYFLSTGLSALTSVVATLATGGTTTDTISTSSYSGGSVTLYTTSSSNPFFSWIAFGTK